MNHEYFEMLLEPEGGAVGINGSPIKQARIINILHEQQMKIEELEELNRPSDPFGWYMWDDDEEDGYGAGFFVIGRVDPVHSRSEQEEYGGDHQGHFWKSHPVYK
jgi:hypothetical protein